MIQLFVVDNSNRRCIIDDTIYNIPCSELSKYTHLQPDEITYECDEIDDQTLELLKLIAKSAKTIHCLRMIPAMHNEFQTKMRGAMIWINDLVIHPDSEVDYIVSCHYKTFPYEIANRITLTCLNERGTKYAYKRMTGRRYKHICIRKMDWPFPDLEADEIAINVTRDSDIPDIIAKCRCTSLKFYTVHGNTNHVHKIDFDGRLSETIMRIKPHLNDDLQSVLKQRRADFNNRRFKRTKAIMSQ